MNVSVKFDNIEIKDIDEPKFTVRVLMLKGEKGDPGSGGGTDDYEDLENLPKINSVQLLGNKTGEQFGLQSIISDLDDIRAGASLGSTSLQEHQDISGKQDLLVSGTNIKTINSQSLLGSGNIVIQGGGGESGVQDVIVDGSSVVTDGVATIPKAGSSNLGVVGVKSVGYSPGIMIDSDGYIKLYSASDAQINGRSAAVFGFNASQIDKIVKAALCDGAGAAYSDSEKNAARSRIGASSASDVSGIQALIPSQATPSNQLADKSFVNSSVATNTAYFKGTYDIVEDLGLTHGASESSVAAALATVITDETNNDYCFVEDEDSAGTTVYRRYKYSSDDVAWVHEFDLNNSSFTAQQWTAINSGITASLANSISGKYVKPSSGIPSSDMTDSVQSSLSKADSALQTHQSLAAYRTSSAQDVIDSGKLDTSSITHETWTFTLDDNTTVQKEVCIWAGSQS